MFSAFLRLLQSSPRKLVRKIMQHVFCKFWDMSGAKECNRVDLKIRNSVQCAYSRYRSCAYRRHRASESPDHGRLSHCALPCALQFTLHCHCNGLGKVPWRDRAEVCRHTRSGPKMLSNKESSPKMTNWWLNLYELAKNWKFSNSTNFDSQPVFNSISIEGRFLKCVSLLGLFFVLGLLIIVSILASQNSFRKHATFLRSKARE